MRLTVHDFSGHPFQAELSRSLASAGHEVEHLHAEQYVSGKGHLEVLDGDAPGLSFAGLRLDLPFLKYSPWARARFEWAYGKAFLQRQREHRSDVVIASNVPLISLFRFARWARRARQPWVLWHQDVYSAGLADELRRRLPRPLAALGARVLDAMEAYCARRAAHVVAIGDGFTQTYQRWGVADDDVSVIPNWAPLDKVVTTPRENTRSADVFPDAQDLRLLYAGTLGRKHNPMLLVDVLRATRERGVPASLTVVSEGEGADDLHAIAEAEPDLGLRVLPFQPATDLSEVLGSADVLVALLEPDATAFSIPSKVLSYMAAGRPILGLMPEGNPAAMDILATGGHVGPPTSDGAVGAVEWLEKLSVDPASIESIGSRARSVAEQKFDLARITTRFATVLARAHGTVVPEPPALPLAPEPATVRGHAHAAPRTVQESRTVQEY
ncbi:glycosyltransferase family 4 protein [Aeromicrobium sp. CTD01-1L150]|uniref:glycosyltransferase family 4 protein n=1 Tax=Aeromicrobium sp. CTD01-1L150 TaxID=3341830 RepID=UPI0035C20253